VRHEITFEAQAAIELEMAAAAGTEGVYPFQVEYTDPWQVDARPMIESIVSELQEGEAVGAIAARFHNTLAVMIAEVCRELRRRESLNKVCLSGGTFQNIFLLERTLAALADYNFEVFLHAKVPPNDGGISLGQAVIANAAIRKES
jgi:hydrogenase maturation protein HypF